MKPVFLLFLTGLLVRCTPHTASPATTECVPDTLVKTIYIEKQTLAIPDSVFHYSFGAGGLPPKYCCVARERLGYWAKQLPQPLRNQLTHQELMVEKIYFLSGIAPMTLEQWKAFSAYDRSLEHHLHATIGMYRGLPSVVFSTQVVSSEAVDQDGKNALLIRFNRLAQGEAILMDE